MYKFMKYNCWQQGLWITLGYARILFHRVKHQENENEKYSCCEGAYDPVYLIAVTLFK